MSEQIVNFIFAFTKKFSTTLQAMECFQAGLVMIEFIKFLLSVGKITYRTNLHTLVKVPYILQKWQAAIS